MVAHQQYVGLMADDAGDKLRGGVLCCSAAQALSCTRLDAIARGHDDVIGDFSARHGSWHCVVHTRPAGQFIVAMATLASQYA